MANSFTSSNMSTIGTVDSTGASDAITANGAKYVDVGVNFSTGSFVGQIDLQGWYRTGAAQVAAWQDIESYTADTIKVARVATGRKLRMNCSAATSGTAQVELTVGNKDG